MPGQGEDDIFRRTEEELCGLREAILANDFWAIETHIARVSDLLDQIGPMLQSSEVISTSERRTIHELTRNLLVLVQKSRRTVCALAAVHQFLSLAECDVVQEPL